MEVQTEQKRNSASNTATSKDLYHRAQNDKTLLAYKVYSQYYALVSLIAYTLVWRGNIFKHIRFFRDILKYGTEVVDIATGDGSLTAAALGHRQSTLKKLTCLDISPEMLAKAKRKLSSTKADFLLGDVMHLPFATASQKTVSCFGGFNSFPEGAVAMKELTRILKPDGIIRGSVLLMPKTPWRQRLVKKWIREGLQSEIVTREKFEQWVKGAGLKFSLVEVVGDVLLFECCK